MFRGPDKLLNLAALCAAVALAAAAASTAAAAANTTAGSPAQTYRWVDDKGVVHYGDSVPAEYAQKERSVLNGQGVEVGHVEGSKSAAELAQQAKAGGTRAPARAARPVPARDLCLGKGHRAVAR